MGADEESIEERLAQATRQIAELESALQHGKSAVQAAEEDAAVAKEEMEQLAYAAGHDLREPLRTIASYSQLLERQFSADKETAELVEYVTDGVKRMNGIITDLLSFSRAGVNPNRKNMSLTLAAQWAVMNLEKPIRESSAKVTYTDLPQAAVDESQIIRLFTNLLDNAIKFKGSETPQIHIGAQETDEGYVISVKDNGLGIDPKYQKQIFTVFKRLHGREVPGTGIGLPICRRIVRAHGGQIWVESDGQNGSTFRFTLPY